MPESPADLVRLIFEYRDGGLRLVCQQSVRMVPPGPSRTGAGRRDMAVALEAADGSLLYRQPIPSAMPTDVEVFSQDPGESVRREPSAPAVGAFAVVVPRMEGADSVVVEEAELPSDKRAPAAGARSWRFPLRR